MTGSSPISPEFELVNLCARFLIDNSSWRISLVRREANFQADSLEIKAAREDGLGVIRLLFCGVVNTLIWSVFVNSYLVRICLLYVVVVFGSSVLPDFCPVVCCFVLRNNSFLL